MFTVRNVCFSLIPVSLSALVTVTSKHVSVLYASIVYIIMPELFIAKKNVCFSIMPVTVSAILNKALGADKAMEKVVRKAAMSSVQTA